MKRSKRQEAILQLASLQKELTYIFAIVVSPLPEQAKQQDDPTHRQYARYELPVRRCCAPVALCDTSGQSSLILTGVR